MGENILNFNNTGTYLPPGFRFHPTDEELIAFYLLKKVLDRNFTCRAIAEIDLNKSEPWELPQKAKMGEKEWYFFSLRDRKYPTGLRTNRATEGGYWKATGKDREIYSSRTCSLLGMKKTLVFYQGRAPKGEKSNWVLHEYRLEGKLSYHYLSSNSKEEWVISRLFKKSGGVGGSGNGDGGGGMKKTGLICGGNIYSDVGSPLSTTTLPPLMDSSTYPGNNNSTAVTDHELDLEHVPCFSIAVDKTPANFNQIDTCYHGGFMMNSADQYPMLTNQTGSINGNGGGVVPAFPSLKLLQENLQLPSFFMSSMMNSTTYPVISSGTPLPYLCNGNSNNNNWVNVVQPKAEMGYMPGTELDYMWG